MIKTEVGEVRKARRGLKGEVADLLLKARDSLTGFVRGLVSLRLGDRQGVVGLWNLIRVHPSVFIQVSELKHRMIGRPNHSFRQHLALHCQVRLSLNVFSFH